MPKTIIDDGFASYLVEGATFVGKYQFPKLSKHDEIIIPKDMIPFDKRNKVEDYDLAINFYMHDKTFRQVLTATSRYLPELSKFQCVISPDCSLYRDMPLCLQIVNTYMNRAIGFYLQRNGIYVIPNVRWGDERSFEFCFQGIPTNDIVCISTHGCIRGEENKYYFRLGLEEMLKVLKPQTVLVHGTMPDEVFSNLMIETTFVHYESYISKVRGGKHNG
jgi:hypothetical protein